MKKKILACRQTLSTNVERFNDKVNKIWDLEWKNRGFKDGYLCSAYCADGWSDRVKKISTLCITGHEYFPKIYGMSVLIYGIFNGF